MEYKLMPVKRGRGFYTCRKCYKNQEINYDGLCRQCQELEIVNRKPIPRQRLPKDPKEQEVFRIFQEEYNRVTERYPLPPIYLKLVREESHKCGSFGRMGTAYSNYHPVIKINTNPPLEDIRKNIIHELCHAVNYYVFGYHGKPAHNKQFWLLTKEFGLTEEDYYMQTQAMKGVFY